MVQRREISARAQQALVPIFSYKSAFIKGKSNMYEKSTNEDGYIVLCTAENSLVYDMLQEKLAQCSPGPKQVISYPAFTGFNPFVVQMARFMSRKFIHTHTVNPTHVVASCGCGSSIDNLFFALCEPGDACIIPAPCYPAFRNDLAIRNEVKIVYTRVDPHYSITRELLEEAYERGTKEGNRISALLLTNPSNPTGAIYTRAEMEIARDWAQEKNIHLISDEIYACSVFNPSEERPFISMADVADMSSGMVHILYGMSKDFAMNGFRVGITYSQNSDLLSVMGNINYFSLPSNHTLHLLSELLSDEQWTDRYLTAACTGLRTNYDVLTRALTRAGIEHHPAQGAQFCWINLRPYLPSDSFEGELSLFHLMFEEAKVILSPGKDCNMDVPGYFRCCFPAVGPNVIQVAMDRLLPLLTRLKRGA